MRKTKLETSTPTESGINMPIPPLITEELEKIPKAKPGEKLMPVVKEKRKRKGKR